MPAIISAQHLADAETGARNLLLNAAGIAPGDAVLLLVEESDAGYYDSEMGAFIAAQAEKLSARVNLLEVPASLDIDASPQWILDSIEAADCTIFLARIGDQLRFRPLPGTGRKIMSYALDFGFLAAPFATTPHGVMTTILTQLDDTIRRAQRCTITCPLGTALDIPLHPVRTARPLDFTVATFPVMIVPPVSAAEASGQLVLSQTLTSTYIHSYPGSILPLSAPLKLHLENGEITDFSGKPDDVARARAQFARVHTLLGGAELRVGSWHAGINPATFYPRAALSDIDRWSGVVFGSPRYAHFHMGGPSPGQICGQVFDPTISFDGEELWKDGKLCLLEKPEITDLLAQHGMSPTAFSPRQDIGVPGLSFP